jgi:hypothetical protein
MIINQIDEIVKNKLTNRHSDFQLEHFVIGNEPNHQAKIHQCLVELQSRRKVLENLDMEILEVNDKKELLKIDKELAPHRNSHEKEIKDRIADRKMLYLDKRIGELNEIKKSTEEESQLIIKMYNFLTEKEDAKDWGSPEVQKDYWNAKLLADLRMRAILGRPIDVELLKTIFALPDGTQVKSEIIQMIQNKANLESNRKNLNNNTNDKPN